MVFNMSQNWKDAWRLMRIPFSIFLMPVFWLAVAVLPAGSWSVSNGIVVFCLLHLLIYPASNGYNSLTDRDTTSIGGLENPPPVNLQLQILVFIFDLVGLGLSFVVNLYFGFSVCVYWLASRAYSSPKIRIKKYPFLSWFVVAFFQGGWTVLMVWAGLFGNWDWLSVPYQWIWPATALAFLAGTYPITQIYQHRADRERGDITISILAGIRGTFYISMAGVFIGSALLVSGFWIAQWPDAILVMALATLPTFLFFSGWMQKCFKNEENANFQHTMRFNQISSICLSAGFILLLMLKSWGIYIFLHPLQFT